ncbi:hypothetical protein SAMN03159391_05729 [Pseudomonas sp. NFACC37-1]|nr:hypothetical protein SAMN03159391_05729 [Pseudomonas sp. NFACC37-1]
MWDAGGRHCPACIRPGRSYLNDPANRLQGCCSCRKRRSLRLAHDSHLGGAPLWSSAVAPHGVIADHCVHCNQCRECKAYRRDDLSAHGFGDHCRLTIYTKLKHGIGEPLNHCAGLNAKHPGNFFCRHALCRRQDKLKFSRRQTPTEVALPCAADDCCFHQAASGCFPNAPVTRCISEKFRVPSALLARYGLIQIVPPAATLSAG